MRVRKKLVVLHTLFCVALGLALLIVVAPMIDRVVYEEEYQRGREVIERARQAVAQRRASGQYPYFSDTSVPGMGEGLPRTIRVTTRPSAHALGDTASPGEHTRTIWNGPSFVYFTDAGGGVQYEVSLQLSELRRHADRAFWALIGVVIGVYLLIALCLELFVLPAQVYRPIGALLEADRAVRLGRREHEAIPETRIPGDELGQIMRSRNETVALLRERERQLDRAIAQLNATANDLQLKNHLLETARRNLEGADRLASLGMMSAGLAHEINTPLAVVKGLAQKLVLQGGSITPPEAQLLARVTGRLEGLSESLLDFARVRPPSLSPTPVRALVSEAWELVSIDREARRVELLNSVPEDLVLLVDAGRMVQVLVNLLRNAVDATERARGDHAFASWSSDNRLPICVSTERIRREGRAWVSLCVRDAGPGIDPQMLGRLFEPFASTRLDARGTGLGLAVSQGIVHEHGGLLQARNIASGGAEFEVLLPQGVMSDE